MYNDVYDDNYLETLMDEDQITPQEAGIMHWIDVDVDVAFETDTAPHMDHEPLPRHLQ